MTTTETRKLEFDQQYADEQLRRCHHPFRRVVKGFYLRSILRDANGPSIDFGCGAGQLLARLPQDSVGLEVNPHLISALQAKGLCVFQASGSMEDFKLSDFPPGKYRTLVIAHVLEHLAEPMKALTMLMSSCRRIGVRRIIVVVPGAKGYSSDPTHKTFIDRSYLNAHLPAQPEGFTLSELRYFPFPWEWIGRYFVFHEMKMVFDQVS